MIFMSHIRMGLEGTNHRFDHSRAASNRRQVYQEGRDSLMHKETRSTIPCRVAFEFICPHNIYTLNNLFLKSK